MIKYPVEYFANKRTAGGKYPSSIGIDCLTSENEVPANAAVVPSDSRGGKQREESGVRAKPSAEGLIMAVSSLNASTDAEQFGEDGEVTVDNEPEDLGLCGATDSSLSPQISPSNGHMPLGSLTNKLINSKPFDFNSYNAAAAANNFNHYQNYYSGSVSLTPNSLNSSSYDNHHQFGNNANPYSTATASFNGHHFAQQQQFATNSFQSQLNQYSQSTNPLAYLGGNNQAGHQQQRLNANNRASTGSSSADTSSTSLSSPPLSSGSENVSPLMALNPNTNQMMIQNASSQLSKYYSSPFNLKSSNGPVAATPVSANPPTNAAAAAASMPANSSSHEGGEGSLPLKKRRPVPSEYKDNSYWEKRRKNNESAKRSRDMRRSKEEHISMRVVFLENENLHLRTECSMLRKEVEQLRAMLYANTNVSH